MDQFIQQPRPSKAIAYALWANAAMLAIIAVLVASRGNSPTILPAAFGQSQQPIAGGSGIYIMPGQFSTNTWGCYLLDVDSQTLCAYQFYPGEKKLRLTAARSYRYDTKLENYNTELPPKEIKAMFDRQAAGQQAAPADQPAADKDKDK